MKENGSFVPEKLSLPKEGEIREINGEKYRWTDTGYTVRQYFCHSTPEKGPGPGWDFRARLLDNDWALAHIGRTFTKKEVMEKPRELLPNVPYFDWEFVED